MEDKDFEIVIKWLKENAYAAKDEQYWLLTDFPMDQVPNRLHIPIKPQTRIWREIKRRLAR